MWFVYVAQYGFVLPKPICLFTTFLIYNSANYVQVKRAIYINANILQLEKHQEQNELPFFTLVVLLINCKKNTTQQ